MVLSLTSKFIDLFHLRHSTNDLNEDIVFLGNSHDSPEDFDLQVKTINRYFRPCDILIIEAPENTKFFEERKARFQTACPNVKNVIGWVTLQAYNQTMAVKSTVFAAQNLCNGTVDKKIHEASLVIFRQTIPSIKSNEEAIAFAGQWLNSEELNQTLTSCLRLYQENLISSIINNLSKEKKLFCDAGILHFNAQAAISSGYTQLAIDVMSMEVRLCTHRILAIRAPAC